jgi:PAS domain S-box-containing protein
MASEMDGNVQSAEDPLGGRRITVLHVDDDPNFTELTEAYLTREDDADFDVLTETAASVALDRLEAEPVDCVVSDYDMPGRNGLEFLDAVRDAYPDLPFILFTGKGSEEVASDAISAGVTDYLQKGAGSESYQLLANRITNAVARRHARTNYREIMEKVPAGIVVHDPENGAIVDMNAKFPALFGYTRPELFDAGFQVIHRDDDPYTIERARELVHDTVSTGAQTFRWPGVTKGGESIWTEVHLRSARLDGRLRVLAVVRDISGRKRQEETLAYERDSLAALFQAVPEPVVHVRVEGEQALVVRVNDAFVDVFGYDRAEVEGRSLDDLIVPDRFLGEGRSINYRTKEATLIEQEVVRDAHDGEREFHFKAAPIVQDEDDVEWVGTYVELTDSSP